MSDISNDERDLVIVRLKASPENRKISIGSFGEFSREELIGHVAKLDSIGRKVVEVEMEWLRQLAKGDYL
ncbi:MAG: hypothetical protein ABIF10_05985 [Candidatus Woesearchaeota archaeon]